MAAAEGDCEKILLSKNIYLSIDVMIAESTDDKICLAHCPFDARQLCFLIIYYLHSVVSLLFPFKRNLFYLLTSEVVDNKLCKLGTRVP